MNSKRYKKRSKGLKKKIKREQVLEFFKEKIQESFTQEGEYVVVTNSAFKGERAIIRENFPKAKESRVEFTNFGKGITFVIPWEYLSRTGEKE